MGDNSRLASWGPEITLALKSASGEAVASKRPLAIMGVMKYIVDMLDSSGVPDSSARLSGPALLESIEKTNEEWGNMTERAFTVFLGGIPKAVTTPASLSGISALVNWLNDQFVANASTGFGGVTFSSKPGDEALHYILVAQSIPTGSSVQMYVSVDGMGVFTAGLVSSGFGSYTGRSFTVPFVSLPDPKGVLDKTVLDPDTISIGVSSGIGMPNTLSATAAFERNSKQRTPWWTTCGGTGVLAAEDANVAQPFRRLAATDCPVHLTPWGVSNGQAGKLWAAGRWAHVNVFSNSEPTSSLLVEINAPGTPSSPGDLAVLDLLGKYGAALNLGYLDIDMGALTDSVAYADGVFTVLVKGTTLAALQAVLEDSGYFSCTLTGVETDTAEDGSYYFLDGVSPQAFEYSAEYAPYEEPAPVVLYGGKVLDDTGGIGEIKKPVTMTFLIDGFPEQEFSWAAGVTYAEIVADIVKVFGIGSASLTPLVDVYKLFTLSGPTVGAYNGFPGVIYISAGTNLDELFYDTTGGEIAKGDCALDMQAQTLTIPKADFPTVSLLLPGDTISDTTADVSATVKHVTASGNTYVIYFDEAIPFPQEGGTPTNNLTHTSRLGVSNYVGVPHQGVWNEPASGDTLWDSKVQSSQIVSLQEVADLDGNSYGICALKLSINYSLTTYLTRWYIRAQGIDIEDEGEVRTPELVISAEDEYVRVRQCSCVNYDGAPYFGSGYTTYASFSGVRQDCSPAYTNKAITISKLSDFDDYGPYDDPRNPVVYGAYRAFIGGAGKSKVKMFPVSADDLSGWMACERMMKKNRFWMVLPMTLNDSVNTWLGLRIKAAEAPSEKRTWCTVLSCVNPTEAFPDTLGSAIGGASNVEGVLRTILVDSDKLNIAGALLAADEPIDPASVTKESSVYIQVSGGGADDTESSYKYLVKEVDTGANSVTVCDTDDLDTEEATYYQGEEPPHITNANFNLYLRGDAIDDPEDKLDALQAKAASFASRKVLLSPNDGVDVVWNGATTRVDGYYGIAAIMGYLQGVHEIRYPLSQVVVPYTEKVYGTNDTYDEMEAIHSLFFLQNIVSPDNGEEIGGVEVCRSFTTYGPSVTKFHDFTATTSFDAAEIRYRDALKDWRKYNNEETTLDALLFKLSAASDAILTFKEAKAAKATTVNFAEGDETEVEVSAEVTAFLGLGKVSMYILG